MEQNAVVWHFSLTQHNFKDLSRIQKTASKISLRNRYEIYQKSLEVSLFEDLGERRTQLCKVFDKKHVKMEA